MLGMPLLDLGGYPEINACGCGDYYLLGDGRARFILYDWFRVAGIWQAKIVGTVTRPIATLKEEQRRFWEEAFKVKLPTEHCFELH